MFQQSDVVFFTWVAVLVLTPLTVLGMFAFAEKCGRRQRRNRRHIHCLRQTAGRLRTAPPDEQDDAREAEAESV